MEYPIRGTLVAAARVFCAFLEMALALMKNAELDYGQNAVF
ncbi:hypothetical protein HMPREF0542_12243 [Ligilactobacillus ruminis ATCC 25644]|uniref:Uncharacterized protein n=1 Tax=Ligilactobacillus ruminis ATCC 25644 TaxID=525362 RepID=E7FTL5_9LACO|nr:hypothetical protein HMPREF0542_12243 [Ligilactobacillus ruminis ATCC 25644]EGX98661.1 hypothetical protein ANHS_764 [Ligilactobacillus ruminis ATCC 25644]